MLDYLPWCFVILVAVDSHKIVPGLVAGHSLVKVFDISEVLEVIEFVFNGSVNGLDITVIAPGPHWNSLVFAAETFDSFFEAVSGPVLSETAYELRAVVGLELDLAKINATTSQMIAKYPGKHTGVYGRLFFCESHEHKSAAYLTSCELIFWQREPFHLWPVVRYVLEILCICAELAEKLPFAFYLAEVFLAFVLLTPLFDQAVLMEYSSDGLVTARQMVLSFEPFRAFERELLSKINDFSCH